MIKKLILSMASAFLASTTVNAASLSCKEVKCYDVEKPTNSGSWCAAGGGNLPIDTISAEQIAKAFNHNKVSQIDVSEDGGDQYSTYYFNQKTLSSLKIGQSIRGTYADQYSWSDGFHTRFKVSVRCIKEQ